MLNSYYYAEYITENFINKKIKFGTCGPNPNFKH